MKKLLDIILPKMQRTLAVGDTILAFDCRGCMATDHHFDYVGKVVGFRETRYAGMAAVVKVIKYMNRDNRDNTFEDRLEPVGNSCIQWMSPGLWIKFQ